MILVAEDEVLLADLLEMALVDQGHEVVVVRDGSSAFDYLATRRVDLLITDFMMPKMTGMELALAIREVGAYADLPILLISGAQASIGYANLYCFDAVMTKPYHIDDLKSTVDRLLKRTSAREVTIQQTD